MLTRVLIVDSNLPFLIRLRKTLEGEGYEVRATSRPRPALKELGQQPFDVAVVDLNIDWVEMDTFIKDMRARQPNLPIVLTGQYPDDPDKVPVLQAQGYLNKPYMARDLLPVIDKALHKGFTPQAAPDADVVAGPEFQSEFEDVPTFEELMEMAREQATTIDEPPIEEEATIGQLLTSLYDSEVEQEILQRVSQKRGENVDVQDVLSGHIEDTQPNPSVLVIPEDEVGASPDAIRVTDERAEFEKRQRAAQQQKQAKPPAETHPDEDTDQLPATAALKLTSNDKARQRYMEKVKEWVNRTGQIKVRPLPSWQKPPSRQELAYQEELLDAIHLAAEPAQTSQEFEEPPFSDQTQPMTLPEVDLYLEETGGMAEPSRTVMDTPPEPADIARIVDEAGIQHELHDVPLPEETPEDDTTVEPRTVSEVLAQEEEALIPTSVEEITQAMGVMLDDDEAEDAARAVTLEPEEDDHPAFETVQPSPDAEAVDEALEEIDLLGHAALRLMDFSLESTARAILLTRDDHVVARSGDLPARTWEQIEDAVFDAWQRPGNPATRIAYPSLDTLGDSLIYSLHTLEDMQLSLVFPENTHMGIIRRQAARIQEALNRYPEAPPAVEAPSEAEEQPEAAETLPSRPTDLRPPEEMRPPEAPAPAAPAPRSETYVSYACAWLWQAADFELSEDYAVALERWIHRIAEENDWDVHALDIGREWVNLHIGVPSKAFIGNVVQTLMDTTNEYLRTYQGRDPQTEPSVWTDGYSVSTPGRLFDDEEIARFARYYHEQKL